MDAQISVSVSNSEESTMFLMALRSRITTACLTEPIGSPLIAALTIWISIIVTPESLIINSFT